MDSKNIFKNIAPSIAVMVIGLVGAYFVYNTYFSGSPAQSVASFEPAAGEETMPHETATDESGMAAGAHEDFAAPATEHMDGAMEDGASMEDDSAVMMQSAEGMTTDETGMEGAPEETVDMPLDEGDDASVPEDSVETAPEKAAH